MTTKTLIDYVDQKGNIASGLSGIDPLGNERRVAVHAPSDLDTSSLAIKINLVYSADECNAKLTPPSEEIFTITATIVEIILLTLMARLQRL